VVDLCLPRRLQQVSAVSPKAQTTREQVIGILQDKATNTQVVRSSSLFVSLLAWPCDSLAAHLCRPLALAWLVR
jgi:cell wall assembly regulator SMI1